MSKVLVFDAITKEQIQDYAEASGDHNKIHLDDEFARAAGLDGVIAHGMLSMGLAARALEEWGYDPAKLQNLSSKFKEKVYPGDKLQAKLSAEKTMEEQKIIDLEIQNQNDTLILTARAHYKA
jgi:acyl dehydratase